MGPLERLPPVLLVSMTLYEVEYPFGQFGSPVPAVSPPCILPTPSLHACRQSKMQRSP